jgi:hypothetical protein
VQLAAAVAVEARVRRAMLRRRARRARSKVLAMGEAR